MMKILLIDDSEADNFIHKMTLEDIAPEAEIITEENAKNALTLLRNGYEPDFIFLDINMPGMDGWDFIEAYRKFDLPEDKLVIMLTTSLNPADRQRAENIPEVLTFINKPLLEQAFRDVQQKQENRMRLCA